MLARFTLTALLLATVGGCSLPGEGPSTTAILSAQEPGEFSLVELSTAVTHQLDAFAAGEHEARVSQPPPAFIGRIGPGDSLLVSLWETQTTTAHRTASDRPAVQVTVSVDPDGTITIPFAGKIRAVRTSPHELEAALVQRLRAQMIEPQASVTVTDDQTNKVILTGEVSHPGRIPLGVSARTVLDVLALGGGARIPVEKAVVRIERKGVVWQSPLGRILATPSLNEPLGPGDRVSVLPLNRRFYAFGAVNRPGEQEFPAEAQNLIQALGRIAGLQDTRADRRGLFIFREQDEARTAKLLPVGSKAEARVVYHLDLREPNAFFVAQRFKIQPEDVVFVSNSPVSDVSKVLSIITGLGAVAATPRNFGLTP